MKVSVGQEEEMVAAKGMFWKGPWVLCEQRMKLSVGMCKQAAEGTGSRGEQETTTQRP